MMMRVRVLPSSSRLTNTVWPRASTTAAFFFGAASAGSGQQAGGRDDGNAVATTFKRMNSSPLTLILQRSLAGFGSPRQAKSQASC